MEAWSLPLRLFIGRPLALALSPLFRMHLTPPIFSHAAPAAAEIPPRLACLLLTLKKPSP